MQKKSSRPLLRDLLLATLVTAAVAVTVFVLGWRLGFIGTALVAMAMAGALTGAAPLGRQTRDWALSASVAAVVGVPASLLVALLVRWLAGEHYGSAVGLFAGALAGSTAGLWRFAQIMRREEQAARSLSQGSYFNSHLGTGGTMNIEVTIQQRYGLDGAPNQPPTHQTAPPVDPPSQQQKSRDEHMPIRDNVTDAQMPVFKPRVHDPQTERFINRDPAPPGDRATLSEAAGPIRYDYEMPGSDEIITSGSRKRRRDENIPAQLRSRILDSGAMSRQVAQYAAEPLPQRDPFVFHRADPEPVRLRHADKCRLSPNEPPAATSRGERVNCSVFAPPSVAPGRRLLIQVFVYRPSMRSEVDALAATYDLTAAPRGFRVLQQRLWRGEQLTFLLQLRGLEVPEPRESLYWQGEAESVQFAARAPADAPAGPVTGKVVVLRGTAPVGVIGFTITVEPQARTTSPQLAGDSTRAFTKAFASYASPDRPEVLKRVQGIRAAGIDCFQDVLDLDPGERWEKKVYRKIDESDVFFLFWSSAARASEWVMKETRYAIDRKSGRDYAPPEIIPVPLEGPPPAAPPPDLAHLHFNDPLLYFIAAK